MIAIIDYGIGNLFSIYNGLKRVYDKPMIVSSDNTGKLEGADGIIVPGVGAFDDCARNFKPFSPILIEIVESGVPVLGICIGMQLFFDESEEGEEKGLGLIPGKVVRLPKTVRVPHMGWNNLHILKQSKLLDGVIGGDYFYFVHSYYCVPQEEEHIVASVEYGSYLAAIVQKNNIYGVQFHPEKSSKRGLHILENFAEICGGR
ncbi:MAG: imidazole glycerol phosphate synthase subunit HisH [Methanocellales archaeon]|nr:imidazole glycerol phosphate synthase subunit HisH [Methanocellales archaeon]MDD3292045.1 imidazole glycerol phosphate synthase subunit HisH [Methanocellales archaeon]MDD5235574.1 imidazole glycerol phosphate synthase subunit HisH [Methanocellales archaeon]MDD5485598.1 imidazole glycerol phosphate synthase subunit HisH [Methanocellales archaeon]